MPKLMTQSEFIERCTKKYGHWFDYSKVKYKNAKTPVLIGCPKHGWFEQTPWRHYCNTKGCFNCGHDYGGSKKHKNTEDFILKSIEVHGDLYDYSNSKYIGCDDDIEIICKRHGSFWQRPANHHIGNGCPKCRNLYTTEYFISEARKIHKDYYDYSLVNYEHNQSKVRIVCPKHGEFEQKARYHLCGKGCPTCSISKGELKIKSWLIDHNISFEPQKVFDDCINPKTGYKLKYDFYLPLYNTVIEYQGKQHYVVYKNWASETKEKLEDRKYKDKIKREYLHKRGIKFVEIKYTIKCIDKILEELVRANAESSFKEVTK